MPASLLLGHLNVHNGRLATRVAARHGCDVLGLNEASRRRAQLAAMRRYRLHQAKPVMGAPPSPRGRDVSGDTATLVRADLPYLGQWHQQVSQQVDVASRVAPDRWFTVAAFEWSGLRVAHFNVHPNAGGKALRDRPNSNMTREYGESMDWLDHMLGVYHIAGYALLLSGDLNMPDLPDDPAWSPYPILKRYGMAWHRTHIDAVAWQRKHFRATGVQDIPKEQVHSDHGMLLVRLALA